MKAELSNGSIVVVPETEFERQWLDRTYDHGLVYKAFTRLDLMSGDVCGMLVDAKSISKEGAQK